MIGLLQRVSGANVSIGGETAGEIGRGLLVLVAVRKDDTAASAERLLERMLGYRVFPDADGRMNLSLRDISGELLLVPQFTLAADTKKGTRASFGPAAAPEEGRRLFELLCRLAAASGIRTATGRFGANMQVSLVNDGPVTFWLET
ncbi:MAG TPA: D-aminoacyl-tRNA deacylase [Gammaproteobacteria bacterium]